MGILNTTPDSFSDGGQNANVSAALRQAESLVRAGAQILDVGGESTRPGAPAVAVDEELRRVVPVLEALSQRGFPGQLSIDTSKPRVAEAALQIGARIVNDVTALQAPGMTDVVVRHGATAILMHMQGEPRTMQAHPHYEDVVREVATFLHQARERVEAQGLPRERIWLDPGIGFGKTASHNLQIIKHLGVIVQLGSPVVLGASRKAFLGHITSHQNAADRDAATATVCAAGALQGAQIFRVHNAAAVRDALLVADALRCAP